MKTYSLKNLRKEFNTDEKCLQVMFDNRYGKKLSNEELVRKENRGGWNRGLKGFLKGQKMGNKNGMWKGDKVGYFSLHEWVRIHKPKPESCEICKLVKGLEIANISQEYKRDLSDWEWICRRCHMQKDGRLAKFIKQ